MKEFQAVHLLDPDGSIGRQTQEWLNVSFRDKADLIAHTFESFGIALRARTTGLSE